MTERGPEHTDAHATYVFAVCRNPDPSAFGGCQVSPTRRP